MTWKDYLIMGLLLINTFLLTVGSSSSKVSNNKEREVSKIHNMQTQTNDYQQLLHQVNVSIKHLIAESSSIKQQLHQLNKQDFSGTQDLAYSTNTHQHQSNNSVERHIADQKNSQSYAEYDRRAKTYIDDILLEGVMGQDDVHKLRLKMSKMSVEEHEKALHRIIMALNNGDIDLPPGVIF